MKINAQKKQYVSPEIEVFMLEVQKPLLDFFSYIPSNTGGRFGSPMPFDDDEEEEDEE